MPSKKNLGRFPTILGDYNQAIHGLVDPEIRELFLDTIGKDIYYYSPAGEYVSLITLIRAGLVDTWLPPCVSFNAIKATYPDPALSTVCAATDTGIIYEYTGNGKWVPISINALKIASEKNDGLMSIELYNAVVEYMNGPKETYIEKNQPIPLPSKRKKNYYYNIFKGMSPSPAEIEWVQLDPIDSITDKPDWPYDRLFDVPIDPSDEDYGKKFEEIDPLYHIVMSQVQVKEEEVPAGYSGVYFLLMPNTMVEVIIPSTYIQGAYPDDWPYGNGFYLDADGNRFKIIDPGYLMVPDSSQVVEVEPVCDVTDVFYDVNMDTTGITVETLVPTANMEYAYVDGWPYEKGFYNDDTEGLIKIIDPGYIVVGAPSEVEPTDPEYGVKNIFYDVDKSDHGITIETLYRTPDKENAYPEGWPYANGFYTNESEKLVKITNPGYLEAKDPSEVKKTSPECDTKDVFYDVLKDTTETGGNNND